MRNQEKDITTGRVYLRWQPIAVLVFLSMVMGANMGMIKIGARDMAPLFMAGVRSFVAAICLYIWLERKGAVLFPSRAVLIHGVVTGILFAGEFAAIYVSLQYTLASRAYVLLYTAPFFAALGAHLFLKNDRLHPWKVAGLTLAFAGVITLFLNSLGGFSLAVLPGDLLALMAGLFWGSTSVYVKQYLAHEIPPLHALFYQLAFSAPILFFMSYFMEDPMIWQISPASAFALFYQCIIIAFLSYLVWFEFIYRYPVSIIHAFLFFTPVFGVFISGAFLMGESITPNLLIALGLVSLGMVLVNRKAPNRSSAEA